MNIPYITIAFMVTFAVIYHQAAESEGESGFLWAGLSVLVSVATFFVLGWGWQGALLGQGALFVGIGIWRAMRKS